jgi:5-methyltetrahydropteroyltriglutamate--homocysteine methyltransferase
MQRTKPPFRADHVGSLLRSAAVKEAREKRARGEISADALKQIEDREIDNVIHNQQAVGLHSVTDGEFRRVSWNYDFLEQLENVESYVGERKIKFTSGGPQPRPILLRVIGKLGGYKPHPMIEHFKYLKSHTRQTAKVTIPSPSSVHFRYGRDVVPESIYPSMDDFYRDLGESYRKVVRAFADVGCRYLQLDEVNLAYLCDPSLRAHITARGDDPAALPKIYADMINAIKVHGYFMEYDSDRAGGFEPLRFVPKGKTVVLGLVTSKTGKLESRDEIKRRIEQAAKFVPLDQLCLSPQRGFASTEEGNVLTEDEQWAKLHMIVEIAEEVWGK